MNKLGDSAARLYYLRVTAQFGWSRNTRASALPMMQHLLVSLDRRGDIIWSLNAAKECVMRTQSSVVTRKPVPGKPVKQPAVKPSAPKRGSKRTEEFLAAVMGMKFR